MALPPLALLLLAACEAPAPAQEWTGSAEVDPSIATLVHVTWSPPDADVTVEFEAGDAPARAATGDGRATLYGIPADTDVRWRLAHGDWHGEWATTRTGPLPDDIPSFTVEGTLDVPYVLVAWEEFPWASTGVYVIDGAGNVVWYWLPTWGMVPVARKTAAGDALLVMHTKEDYIEDATVELLPLDGSAPTVEPLPYAHHDVLEVPDARYAAIVGEVREDEGEAVVGDTIVEVGEDGGQRVVWSAFDALPVVRHESWGVGTYPAGADWTHANGLDYDPDEGAYYLSLFYQRCVVKIDRATGETLWILGGDHGTLALPDDTGPRRQHAPEATSDGVAMFDNAYGDDAGSRLVRYTVDEGAETASLAWEWHHPDALFTLVLGDVDLLDDGGALSSWGTFGEIVRADAAGDVTWRARITPGYLVAQVEAFEF